MSVKWTLGGLPGITRSFGTTKTGVITATPLLLLFTSIQQLGSQEMAWQLSVSIHQRLHEFRLQENSTGLCCCWYKGGSSIRLTSVICSQASLMSSVIMKIKNPQCTPNEVPSIAFLKVNHPRVILISDRNDNHRIFSSTTFYISCIIFENYDIRWETLGITLLWRISIDIHVPL